jgi:rare lipoprotein A (peptidoglycan hydrolase)
MKTICLLFAFLALSSPCLAQDGYATYYTEKSCQIEGTSGVWCASGQRFNEQALTCAMRRRDWGTKFLVTGPAGSAIVTLNDLGPGKKATKRGVIIDLTPKAFIQVCGSTDLGRCKVTVKELN